MQVPLNGGGEPADADVGKDDIAERADRGAEPALDRGQAHQLFADNGRQHSKGRYTADTVLDDGAVGLPLREQELAPARNGAAEGGGSADDIQAEIQACARRRVKVAFFSAMCYNHIM